MITTQQELLMFSAAVKIKARAAGKKRPRFSIIAYTGGALSIPGWAAPVVVDLDGLQIPDSTPLLIDHQNSLDQTIGEGRAKTDGRTLTISGFFNSSDAALKILRLSKDGQTLRASVGIQPDPDAVEYLEPNTEFECNGQELTADSVLGVYTVHAAELREISIVVIGADSKTSVSIAARLKTGITNMFTKTKNVDATTALSAERQRAAAINATCDSRSGLITAEAMSDIRAQALASGSGVSELNELILDTADTERQRQSVNAQFTMPTGIGNGRGADISHRDVLACAVLGLVGDSALAEKAYSARVNETARALGVTSSLDLFKIAATWEGIPFHGSNNALIEAGFSTASLPIGLADSLGKALSSAYMETPASYVKIAQKRSVRNFHTNSMVRPFHAGSDFLPIAPTGELKYSALGEDTIPHSIDTRGRMFSIDRKMVINDDIGVIFDLIRQLGANGRRTVGNVFWSTILAADTFYSADHGNLLTGAGTVLSIASLSAAIQAMREQTDSDGQAIDVMPLTLAIPPALESTGRALLSSIELHRTADQDPTGNPWTNQLDLAVESRLAAGVGGSDTAWYLFADPRTCPAVLLSLLNGIENPTVERILHTESLGVKYRAFLDFGIDPGDYRGTTLATGEAE